MDLKRKGILISLMTIALMIAFIPMGSGGESRDAIVRVEYEGYYTGRISGDETQEIAGEWNMDFPTRGEIIYVIMTKSGADDKEMMVSIIVDGETKIYRSTSSPNGEVRMTWSFYVGGDGNGGEEDEDGNSNSASDDDGFGISCASMLSVSILIFLVATLIIARIRKG